MKQISPNTVQYIRRNLKGVKVNEYKSGTVEPEEIAVFQEQAISIPR